MNRRIGLLVAALLVASLAMIWPRSHQLRLSADFVSSVGVYQGSEVRLMGVPIGRVTTIEPHGGFVRVSMTYDAKYRLAANADAVIVSPSVVADRFVQLTPAYGGSGPTLPDGAHLGVSRTRVPVELDRIFRTAHDLLDALGPRGANDSGAVNRFLHVGAADLRGNGGLLHDLIQKLSGATSTLGSSSNDFFASVSSLEQLTGTLAAGDGDVRAFDLEMEKVIGFLADERGSLGQVLDRLAGSFGRIETFVRENRAALSANVNGLKDVTAALVAERVALEEVLHRTPVGLDNLNRTWDPQMQAVRSRSNELEILKNLDGVLCDAITGAGVPQPALVCKALHQLLGRAK